MNYQKNYDDLISHAKTREKEINQYYELHHILPRSMGGQDIKENLVYLTAREHYLAHYMLWKIYQNQSMMLAFHLMSLCGKYNIFSSRAYEKVRKEFAKTKSKQVICLQNLKVFDSVRQAARWIMTEENIEESKLKSLEKNLSSLINNGRRSCHNYSFEVFDPIERYARLKTEHIPTSLLS